MINNKRILLASPHMSDEGFEKEYINDAFNTNWIAPLGPNVDGFENEVKDFVKSKEACALSSGTAAIHLGLKYLGVGEGDTVIVSTLTFAASANPICYLGAKPVFVDSELDTWNMCPKALEKALQQYPNTKAVITVNLYGQSCDYDEIKAITSKYNVPILEDAAESLGATYKGVMTGTIGDIGIYSFNGNKIITTSGGGILVSNLPGISEKLKFWSTQSRENKPYYYHEELGHNYRMSNILAGIGRGQLRILDERINKKKLIYNKYKESFKNLPIEMQPIQDFGKSNYWLSCMLINSDNITPESLINHLSKNNVESRYIWNPLHKHPYFKEFDYFVSDSISVSDIIFNKGICLPSDTKMTEDEQNYVIDLVVKYFEGEKNV